MGQITGCRMVALVAYVIDSVLEVVVFDRMMAATSRFKPLARSLTCFKFRFVSSPQESGPKPPPSDQTAYALNLTSRFAKSTVPSAQTWIGFTSMQMCKPNSIESQPERKMAIRINPVQSRCFWSVLK